MNMVSLSHKPIAVEVRKKLGNAISYGFDLSIYTAMQLLIY
jgi:hypothetical protein